MIPNVWYPALRSTTLSRDPVGVRRIGRQLVFWRDASGVVHGMTDRCPHKGVLLSKGTVVGDRIRCGYHGFEFDGTGQCQLAPCLGKNARVPRAVRAETWPVREAHGLIWVFNGAAADVLPDIPWFPELETGDLVSGDYEWEVECNYVRYMESLTETHHVPFVHQGLKIPMPQWLLDRLDPDGSIGWSVISGQATARETLCDRLEIWEDGEIMRSAYHLREDDGASFEQSPGHRYQISLILPCLINVMQPVKSLQVFVTCTPIDDENTWLMVRYHYARDLLPFGLARPLARLSAWAERRMAQPQDWVFLERQTPNVISRRDRRFVASDALNALYLKRRAERLAAAADHGRLYSIDESTDDVAGSAR